MESRKTFRDRIAVLVAAVVLTLTGAVSAEIVNFPDANLEQAVRDMLHIPSPTPITDTDMAGLECLLCGPAVGDLSGLESASNLWSLWVSDNGVSDLSPIAGLSSLLDVNVTNCQIQELPENLAWGGIVDLNLNGNLISDIRPLASLSGIPYLINLNDNQSATSQP